MWFSFLAQLRGKNDVALFHFTMRAWPVARSNAWHLRCCLRRKANKRTTGFIVLHVIRCLQTLCTARAAALWLMAAARKGLWSEHFFNHLLLNQYISARAAQSWDTDSRLAV